VRKKSAHATEQDRPDVLKQRKEWFDGQLDFDPEQLVFIDETSASTNMARAHPVRPHPQPHDPQIPARKVSTEHPRLRMIVFNSSKGVALAWAK
jgi:hypothetical protein